MRVVRFSDVTSERVQQLITSIEEAGGPPTRVPTTGIQLLFDEAQGTAVVLQLFDSAEEMEQGADVLNAMDPSDTPGTRLSVDMCESKLDIREPQADRPAAV